jgi:hypothetical protein
MATWHQARAGEIRPIVGKYQVVSDPPHECRGVRVYDTMHEAEEYRTNLLKHHPRLEGYVYITKPAA